MLNLNVLAIAIVIMGFVKDSGMSCNALYTAGAWLTFYIIMFIIMEVHMRGVDREMKLFPKRSFTPITKRLFGRDAPVSNY